MLRGLLISLASVVVACAPAQHGAKANGIVRLAPPRADTDEPVARADEPTAIPFPPARAAIACRLSNRVLYTKGEAPLELCADAGACYLELTGAPVQAPLELQIAAGAPARALLQVREQGFELRGLVDLGRVQLLTAQATVVAGFVVPNVVYVASADAGKLHLTVEADATLKPVSPIAIDLPCDAVTPYGSFIAHEQRLAAAGLGTPASTREVLSASVPLSLTPGGPSVASVELDGGAVDAHEVRGAATRIAFTTDDGALVFGWVPTQALGAAKPGTIGSGSSGHGDAWVVEPDPTLDRSCPVDVPLAAEVEGRRFAVGTLLAHARFRLGPRVDAAFYQVEPPARLATRDRDGATHRVDNVRLVGGATLLVRRRDAAVCGAP